MADYPPYPIAVLQNLKNMKKKKSSAKMERLHPDTYTNLLEARMEIVFKKDYRKMIWPPMRRKAAILIHI